MIPWNLEHRAQALQHAATDGVELLVIGGGITGAGVLRDAAQRGLSALLVEADDFAGGTSSATSKMIHGGLRYLAEGQLAVTRQSCVERDQLRKLNPNLVRDLPFLFCAFEDGVKPWKVRVGLTAYSLLAGFGKGRFHMLSAREVQTLSRDLRRDGLKAAGLYYDARVDDARFVLQVLKAARHDGADAISHAAVTGFEHDDSGRLTAATIEDRLTGESHTVSAQLVVNATGPGVDSIRSLDRQLEQQELRPAKGVHIVIRRDRVHADAAVACQAEDGRNMFLCPWDDVHIIGTTDTFTDDDNWQKITGQEADYLLEAINRTFPDAGLQREDIVSAYVGVRPLVAKAGDNKPASSVSREHRITEDPSGLISVAGGKLTTFRAMAEDLVNRVVRQLPTARRGQLNRCRTSGITLRTDTFDRSTLLTELGSRYHLSPEHSERLIEAWGANADELLGNAPSEWREPIGNSRYIYAEVAWALQYECAANLCDILEHRLRLASLCPGQGLQQLDRIASVAARTAGWSDDRMMQEMDQYRDRVKNRYQVQD